MEQHDGRIETLKKIYDLHDEVMGDFDQACKKGCASCCTCNVTMTGLETAYLLSVLTEDEKKDLKESLHAASSGRKFVPRMTTNGFARLCMEGADIPEEEIDPAWGRCPVIRESVCPVYDGRPLGCRVMISTHDCGLKGFAQMPPVAVAVNQVFLQAVEHLDQGGISGNFSDMITLFLSGDQQEKSGSQFVSNEKIPVWMVEPAHRETLMPVIKKLSSLCAV